jgi:hypothetical protein
MKHSELTTHYNIARRLYLKGYLSAGEFQAIALGVLDAMGYPPKKRDLMISEVLEIGKMIFSLQRDLG